MGGEGRKRGRVRGRRDGGRKKRKKKGEWEEGEREKEKEKRGEGIQEKNLGIMNYPRTEINCKLLVKSQSPRGKIRLS